MGTKILFYNHTSEVSGAEFSMLLLMLGFKNYEIALIAPEGELLQRARAKGIRVIPIRANSTKMTRNLFGLLRGLFKMWLVSRDLKKIISIEQPNILHANSIRAGIIASFTRRPKQTKLIWHIHDNLSMDMVGRGIRFLAQSSVNKIVGVSKANANNFAISSALKAMTTFIYNAVETTSTSTKSIRPELGVNSTSFVVGVVGQITPWKRQEDAIDAFQVFVREHPNSELWIVGAPKFNAENLSYEEKLKNQVKKYDLTDKVRFLGFREDIANVMFSIDVLVLPSENEPFGRVIIEAMLAGKPVIATNGGGVPEIIEHGKTGFIVPNGDINKITNYLNVFICNKTLLNEMGYIGQNRVINLFSAQNMWQSWSQLYNNL